MYFAREKEILKSLAQDRWRRDGPGILFGRIDSGLILEEWIPLGELTDERPGRLAPFLSEDAWKWLRAQDLVSSRIETPTVGTVILCRPPSDYAHPELEVVDVALRSSGAEK